MNYWLLLIPVLSAFIGWFIIWMTIYMLFKPLEPKKFLGFTIQGVFPGRQQQLAEKLGKLVSTEFISLNDLEQKISNPTNFQKLMPMIEQHVDDFLRVRLKEQMPMISMFIGDKTINSLKEVFMKELETLFPQVMTQFAGNMMYDLNLEKVVSQKISSLSSDKLAESLNQNMGKELRLLKIFGILVGLVIGLLQLLIAVLTS